MKLLTHYSDSTMADAFVERHQHDVRFVPGVALGPRAAARAHWQARATAMSDTAELAATLRRLDPQLVLDFDTRSPQAAEELDELVRDVWHRNPVVIFSKVRSGSLGLVRLYTERAVSDALASISRSQKPRR